MPENKAYFFDEGQNLSPRLPPGAGYVGQQGGLQYNRQVQGQAASPEANQADNGEIYTQNPAIFPIPAQMGTLPPRQVVSAPPRRYTPPQAFAENALQPAVQPAANPSLYDPSNPAYYANTNATFTTEVNTENTTMQIPQGNYLTDRFNDLRRSALVEKILRYWWMILAVVILLLTIVFTSLFVLSRNGWSLFGQNTDQIGAGAIMGRISAEPRVASGSLSTWKINFENQSGQILDKVRLYLQFDPTFTFSRSLYQTPEAARENEPYGSVYNIGQLRPQTQGGSTAQIMMEGTLTGDLDTDSIMRGKVSYQLVGKNEIYTSDLHPFTTKIGAPQLTVDVNVPPTVKNGSETDMFVNFRNSSDKPLTNLRLKMTYPESSGFRYISSEMQLSKESEIKRQPDEGDNIWLITQIPRFTPQQLKIRGQFLGVPDELKKVEVEIGMKNPQSNDFIPLVKRQITVRITGEKLQVTTRIVGKEEDKLFKAGENLNFEINYFNTSTQNLEDMSILASVQDGADILDLSTVSYTGGNRGNYNNGQFEWRQSGAPQLRLIPPNGSGKLNFNIRVKEGKDFLNGKNQSSFTLRPKVIVKAIGIEDVAMVGDEYKAVGNLSFDSQIQNQNNEQRLRPGITASYRVTWKLANTQNQINNVIVRTRTILPASSWDQASVLPMTENSNLSYDKTTGEIIWNAGNLPGYTGINTDSKSVSFILTFTGTEAQINAGGASLYENVSVVGTDDFTGQRYDLKIQGVRVTQ